MKSTLQGMAIFLVAAWAACRLSLVGAGELHPDEEAVAHRLKVAGFTYNQQGDLRLRQIFAPARAIPPDALVGLEACQALQSISLGDDPSHFEALANLPELPNLELFGVTVPLRPNCNLKWVPRMPRVNAVNFEAPQDEKKLPPRALWQPGDSNAAVAALAAWKELRLLRLNRQQVTDAGLAPLVALQQLHHMELNHTPISDAALETLGKLTNLETLYLEGTAITDRGLPALQNLARLESLKLDHTNIGDRGIATLVEFEGLRHVRNLYLSHTQLTNEGLKSLAQLPELAVLDISGTKVSDEGLVHLAGLKKLYNLGISGIDAREETVDWLREQLPNRQALYGYTPPPLERVLDRFRARRFHEPGLAKVPLYAACREWQAKRDAASRARVLKLADEFRQAVNTQLPRAPYDKPIGLAALADVPAAAPGRHTLLSGVAYTSPHPPGPGESYIHTSLVYLDGNLVAAELPGSNEAAAAPKPLDAYIANSVVLVDGGVGITSYISNSLVIASGPIVLADGYISNSLVVSLEGLGEPKTSGPPTSPTARAVTAAEKLPAAKGPPPPRVPPSILLRNGYIWRSAVVGRVECGDLRECLVLGQLHGREVTLRGADVVPLNQDALEALLFGRKE